MVYKCCSGPGLLRHGLPGPWPALLPATWPPNGLGRAAWPGTARTPAARSASSRPSRPWPAGAAAGAAAGADHATTSSRAGGGGGGIFLRLDCSDGNIMRLTPRAHLGHVRGPKPVEASFRSSTHPPGKVEVASALNRFAGYLGANQTAAQSPVSARTGAYRTWEDCAMSSFLFPNPESIGALSRTIGIVLIPAVEMRDVRSSFPA